MKGWKVFFVLFFIVSRSYSQININYELKPFYKYRKDKKPGREVVFIASNSDLNQINKITISHKQTKESHKKPFNLKGDSLFVLLPSSVGVENDDTIKVQFHLKNGLIEKEIIVPYLRQWIVFIYPHSHVDIGYSNTQENVEVIHKRNLLNAIRIAKQTEHFPEGARFVWNTEVTWPIERYLYNATKEQREEIYEAIKKGYINTGANYLHVNTSACSDEELFELFRFKNKLETITNVKINTYVQVDIPGMSWGLLPVLQQNNIKYILHLYNGDARVGHTKELTARPFWWVSPDKTYRVLFFQPNDDGYLQFSMDKGASTGRPWFAQINVDSIPETIKTNNPEQYFLGKSFFETLNKLQNDSLYPYRHFAISWALWDNAVIDEDLPYAVKLWNEKYAFPKLIIASASQIMETFDVEYGSKIPEFYGDLTEYWTDGLGSVPDLTSLNIKTKEKLLQTEALWSLIKKDSIPRDYLNEAWRNVLLSTEHTYVYERMGVGEGLGAKWWSADRTPIDAYYRESLFNVKKQYFFEANKLAKYLFQWAISPYVDKKEKTIVVFNTLSWKRPGILILNKELSKLGEAVFDEDGRQIISQKLNTGEMVLWIDSIQAYETKTLYFDKNKSGTIVNTLKVSKYKADNGILSVELDSLSGNIKSLKLNNIEFVDYSKKAGFNVFYHLYGGEIKPSSDTLIDIKITEKGPLLVEFTIKSKAIGCNLIEKRIRLFANCPFLLVENRIEKQKITNKEGLHIGFSANISNPIIRYDIPNTYVSLEQLLKAANKNWLTVNKWINVANNEKNLTIIPFDSPLFQIDSLTANIMGETGDWVKEIKNSNKIFFWVYNNHWYTNFPLSYEGEMKFSYAILPQTGDFSYDKVEKFSLEQRQDLVCFQGKADFEIEKIKVKGSDKVIINSLKTYSDGKTKVIRLKSLSDKTERIRIECKHKPYRAYLCEACETPTFYISDEIQIRPRSILTIRLEWD